MKVLVDLCVVPIGVGASYKAFPGPNSNTFAAWIAKQVPELGLELPFSAIGSGYSESANK